MTERNVSKEDLAALGGFLSPKELAARMNERWAESDAKAAAEQRSVLANNTVRQVSEALAGRAIITTDEAILGNRIASIFIGAGIEFQREVRLSPRDRVDFLVQNVGIELKVDGSAAALIRQLDRYAQSDQVDALILVTTRRAHRFATTQLRGKPIQVICMAGV